MSLYEEALNYCINYRFCVIPLGDKKPLLDSWEEYQKRIAEPEEIEKWWKKNPEANIGIVTGNISNLAVIDIDTREGEKSLLEKFPKLDLKSNPIASSPRGGKHIYYACDDLSLRCSIGYIAGCDFKANGGYIVAPPSIRHDIEKEENGKPYEWVNPLFKNLNELDQEFKTFVKTAPKVYVEKNGVMFNEGSRDNDLFHIGHQLKKSGTNYEAIRQTMYLIGKNCSPPLPDREIETKFQSVISFNEKKEGNMTEIVESWIKETDGGFSTKDCSNFLLSSGFAVPKHLRTILLRLKDQGVIAKFGDKDGHYVKINNTREIIDLTNVPENKLELVYPFKIETMYRTFPKNIVIVAGSPDAGKTAFFLNIARMNMDKYPIFYFSSEMGEMELLDRLSKFEGIQPQQWTPAVTFINRSSNFHEVIEPDGINLIDYLEMPDKIYDIGKHLNAIFEKLKSGIAIVAIQKKRGANLGYGQEFGEFKARLYLSMEAGKIKIMKIKNWVDPKKNYHNYSLEYKLHKGCEFEIMRGWELDEK